MFPVYTGTQHILNNDMPLTVPSICETFHFKRSLHSFFPLINFVRHDITLLIVFVVRCLFCVSGESLHNLPVHTFPQKRALSVNLACLD